MSQSLTGRTIALAEGRQVEELARMLEEEGATTFRCPLLSIVDAPDLEAVRRWIQEAIHGDFDFVILLTGEALARLLSLADADGTRDAFLAAISGTKTITRGPKPTRALRELGLSPYKIAVSPTTEGIIATLASEPLAGRTVGYTLYGSPNPLLDEFLSSAGAKPVPVLSYVHAPGSSVDRILELVDRLASGAIDALVFTSSPQVERLFAVASEKDKLALLRQGLKKTRLAAVGPVVAETLKENGAPPDICPSQGWVMKNLVQYIKRDLTRDGNCSRDA